MISWKPGLVGYVRAGRVKLGEGQQGKVRLVKLVWHHPCALLCTFGNAHLSHTWQHGFAVYEFGQCAGGVGVEFFLTYYYIISLM